MTSKQILDIIAANRDYLKIKSNNALQNLALLHHSFDTHEYEDVILSLALNDSVAAIVFGADYAGAIAISQQVIDKLFGSRHIYYIASHEMLIGRCHALRMNFAQAWFHLRRAETLAMEQLHDSMEARTLRADIMHDIAMTMTYDRSGGDLEEAIRYFEQALTILGQRGFRARRGVCLMGIGNVRFTQGQLEEALTYYKRADTLLKTTDSYANLSTLLCNIGSCYMNLGDLRKAEQYLIRSLELRTRVGTYGDIAISYFNLGALYERRGDVAQAYDTMITSRDFAMVSQFRELQIRVISTLEEMARALGDTAAADLHHSRLKELVPA